MKPRQEPFLCRVEWYVLSVVGFIAAMLLGANLWFTAFGCPA